MIALGAKTIEHIDEIKQLFAIENETMMNRCRNKFPTNTIIKGIANENWLVVEGKVNTFPFYPVDQVIDEVGAGDAFAAGFIAGLCKRESIEDCMNIAELTSALSIQLPGDWEGLPTWSQVENLRFNRGHKSR